MSFNALAFLLFFLGSITSMKMLSVPESQTTTLPVPAFFDERDHLMLQAIAQLQVFRDDHDKDHYYYVPPLVLSQQQSGAFAFYPNKKIISLFADLRKIIVQRMDYGLDELTRLKNELAISNREVKRAHDKLKALQTTKNKEQAIFWRKVYASEQREQQRAEQKYAYATRTLEQKQSLLSESISDSFNQKAIVLLAHAGWNFVPSKPENTDTVFSDIIKNYLMMMRSYGGYMSINTIAGLSEWHLEQLRHYKTKYMPHIKISLFPIEKLVLSPLATVYEDRILGTQEVQMLLGSAIMPDYFGSTLFFNMTVLGASAWAQRLGPHLIPLRLGFSFQRTKNTQTEQKTNFCLSFQEHLQNYDRCSNDQHKSSLLMVKALEEVARSPLCERISDPFGCGLLRGKIGQVLLQ